MYSELLSSGARVGERIRFLLRPEHLTLSTRSVFRKGPPQGGRNGGQAEGKFLHIEYSWVVPIVKV